MPLETSHRKESTNYKEEEMAALGGFFHNGTELYIIVAIVVLFTEKG